MAAKLLGFPLAKFITDEQFCCIQQWLNSSISCGSDAVPDVSNFSARKLRNLLLQDLRIDRDIVYKILDRKELKDLAESVLMSSSYSQCQDYWWSLIMTTSTVVVLVVTLAYFNEEVLKLVRFFTGGWINTDLMHQRFRILRKCLKKNRSPIGVIAAVLAIILDVISFYIQLSAFLSWLVPYHWTIYRYLWFGISLPVNASDIMGQYMGARKSQDAWKSAFQSSSPSSGSWTINAGPMLTLTALRFISNKLDEYAVKMLVQVRNSRRSRGIEDAE